MAICSVWPTVDHLNELAIKTVHPLKGGKKTSSQGTTIGPRGGYKNACSSPWCQSRNPSFLPPAILILEETIAALTTLSSVVAPTEPHASSTFNNGANSSDDVVMDLSEYGDAPFK